MGVREAKENEEIKPAEFVYRNIFMSMEHNYLCAVCRENPAVIVCNKGILQPCWACMKDYKYLLVAGKTKWQRFLLRMFFKDLTND